MRLKHIKIAGFKSFVDPTTIVLPENMTCIVGPNGCGKSNTIDAVRWVMGESSAKHLRGDSSTDVIFAGSSGRKPVSQASVEMLFDNTDNKIVGEYAQYSEIAVRRVLTRDGQSQYFLNNTKCRRRDVTELFLGTGLGPRSYAIIEQGMISNLITAKPEELRIFLEEAAGISKYKERRKETEQRMKRTRENLERLFDIREELGRQLGRLEKQAADAEIFKNLQSSKRQKQAELAYIRLRKVVQKKQSLDQQVLQQEVNLEAGYADRREAETTIETIKQTLHKAQDTFYEKQRVFYQIGTSITKLEEAQRHQQRRHSGLIAEQSQLQESLNVLQQHQAEDQARLSQFQIQLADDEPEVEILEDRIEAARERYESAQESYTDWQNAWQSYVQGSATPREASQIAQVKIQQHEKNSTRLDQRQHQLSEELSSLEDPQEQAQFEKLRQQQHAFTVNATAIEQELVTLKQALSQYQQRKTELSRGLKVDQAVLDQAQGRLASLLDVQQKSLKTTDTDQLQWLQQHDLESAPVLAQQLEVERRWQEAVEQLLGSVLTGVVVEPAQLVSLLANQSPKMTYLLTTSHVFEPGQARLELTRLVDAMSTSGALVMPSWLQSVYLAQDLQQAQDFVDQLLPYESILTATGQWLGPGWACLGQGDGVPGLLVMQQDIDDLHAQVASSELRVTAQQTQLQALEQDSAQVQQQCESVSQNQKQLQARSAQVDRELSGLDAKNEQVKVRRIKLQTEIQECQTQLATEIHQLQKCRGELEQAVSTMAQYEDQRLELEAQQDALQQAVQMGQASLQQDQDRLRTLAEAVKFSNSNIEAVDRQLARYAEQTNHQQHRLEQLRLELEEASADQTEIEGLPDLLAARQTAELDQINAKNTLEHEQQLRQHQEQQKQNAQVLIDRLRTTLEGLRIQVQAQQSDLEHIQLELDQHKVSQDQLELQVPEQAAEGQWRQDIAAIEVQVERLGAINLAAVAEFEAQTERKTYMDDQYADLETALFTLEEAINEIDQETRERFQKTFDDINQGMGSLFPRLFGGGQAELQLVGDDVLNAGVTIMARPPGKKNTSIHMLSGGEKALTAISLVFAIFQLNPSPFCMLDEVDAPLDDANVGRYADMVKHMSETVQFIYISHNKIAMEKAEHLMGVTMQEPGVSRLVSVDIGEASAMAGV